MTRRWTRWMIMMMMMVIFVRGCNVFMRGIGTVTPFGDVKELVGSTIRLQCVLDENHTDVNPGDVMNLIWKKDSVDVDSQYIRVVGNYTKELLIPNANASDSGAYICLMKRANESKYVCHNKVMVGTPPMNVTDFFCVAPNWQYLLCNFSMTSNLVQPTYKLTYTRQKRFLENITCDLIADKSRKSYYCNITSEGSAQEDVRPPYSQVASWYNFTLNANNTFGFDSWNFNINHFQIVRPGHPRNITVSSTPRNLSVGWLPHKKVASFPPGLLYRIYYKSQWDRKDDWKVLTTPRNITLTDLIPFTNYTLKLQAKSMMADDKRYWGENVTFVYQTKSSVPSEPPRLPFSAFQEISYLDNRTVILFWQMIPDYEHNGMNFKYKVETQSSDDRIIQPQNITANYAIFTNLQLEEKYTFTLSSENAVGKSVRDSFLTVHKKSQLPNRPESITTIFFGNGVYELSWNSRKTVNQDGLAISSYTLFWCNNIKPHPFTCLGNLSWIEVGVDVRAYNVTVNDEFVNYHFAIAANSGTVSSGMVWASCIVPYNGTLNKMKTPGVIAVNSTRLKVTWTLDCSERIGIVSGFRVYYCPIEINSTKAPCIGDQKSIFQRGSHAKETDISGLKPYSLYKVTVAAITRAGEGEQSDVTFARTSEDSPQLAMEELRIVNKTNTSISLAWLPPKHANGIIEKYEIFYNGKSETACNVLSKKEMTYTIGNLTSYTNYTLKLVACNGNNLCSNDFRPIVVSTKIGVPGVMSRPQVNIYNATHVLISFEDPVYPNGPINMYNLMVTTSIDSTNNTHWLTNVTAPEVMVAARCDDKEYQDAVYTFGVAAVNLVDGYPLVGPLSDTTTYNCLLTGGPDTGTIVGVVIATVCVSLLLLAFGCVYSRCRRQVHEMKNIKIYLPKGLESDNLKSPSREFSNIYPKTSTLWSGPTKQADYVNSRQRNTSGETRLSVTSMDELLQGHMTGRLNQSVSGDTNSGLSSVSSVQTTRSNLSSDSASSDLDSIPPTTPDAVFVDPMNNIHKLLLPVATLEVLPETSPPANYSQLARNFGSDGYLPTTATVVPVGNQSDAGSQDGGYVLPSDQGSYSQIGVANGGYMNVPNVNVETAEGSPTYSQVAVVPRPPLEVNKGGYVTPKSMENGNSTGNEVRPKQDGAEGNKTTECDDTLPIQYSRLSFHDPKAGNGYVTLPDLCPTTSKTATDAGPSTSNGNYVALELVDECENSGSNRLSDDPMKASMTSDEGMKSSITSSDEVMKASMTSDEVMKSSLTSDGYDSPGPYSRVLSMNFEDNGEKES